MTRKSYRAFQTIAGMGIVGLVLSLAIPSFGTMRMSKSFHSGEAAVRAVLARARASAMDSGRAETRVVLEGSVLRVRAGTEADAPVVAEVDVTGYGVALEGMNLPIRLDARGRRTNASPPMITITNRRISAERTLIVGPHGDVSTS